MRDGLEALHFCGKISHHGSSIQSPLPTLPRPRSQSSRSNESRYPDGGKTTTGPNDAPIFVMVHVQESCCLASETWTILKGKRCLRASSSVDVSPCGCLDLYSYRVVNLQ